MAAGGWADPGGPGRPGGPVTPRTTTSRAGGLKPSEARGGTGLWGRRQRSISTWASLGVLNTSRSSGSSRSSPSKPSTHPLPGMLIPVPACRATLGWRSMVRPSGTRGAGSTWSAGGPSDGSGPRARARHPAAPATRPDAPRARIRICRVARRLPPVHHEQGGGGGAMRVVGMDIHRAFAEAVALLDGKVARLGRVGMRRDRLEEFARSALAHDDHVVVEATGNAAAVPEVLAPHVGRGGIADRK